MPFVRKKEEWLATEAIHHEKFDKRWPKLWLRQGRARGPATKDA
jgi:hypothetical protein